MASCRPPPGHVGSGHRGLIENASGRPGPAGEDLRRSNISRLLRNNSRVATAAVVTVIVFVRSIDTGGRPLYTATRQQDAPVASNGTRIGCLPR